MPFNIFSKIYKAVINILFPTSPTIKRMERMTAKEIKNFLPLSFESPNPFTDSIFDFRNNATKEAIYHIKYKGNVFLMDRFGEIILEKIYREIERKSYKNKHIHITPIPLSKERFKKRKFNQSELLAKSIIKHDKKALLIFSPQFLKRIKDTKPQTKLKRSQRLINIKGCYSVPVKQQKELKGKTIILIDDVATTGSTLKEARVTLLKAGAEEVKAVTVAH